MSATPRTISTAPDLRQLLAAVGALILAVALLVAVMISRQGSVQTGSAAIGSTQVTFDHGWSSAGSQAAPVEPAYTGYPSLGQELVVRTENGGIRYTGIPYPAADDTHVGGSNGTRFAQ